MFSLAEHIKFVQAEAAFAGSRAAQTSEPHKAQKFQKRAEQFHNAADAMALADLQLAKAAQEQKSLQTNLAGDQGAAFLAPIPEGSGIKAVFENPLGISPDHLEGLPPELIQQLNISETDRFEANVVQLINRAGGTMLLDNIMIGMYHMTKEVHNRTQFGAKLYRMTRKKMIWSVPSKKGVYTTTPVAGAEDESQTEAEDQ